MWEYEVVNNTTGNKNFIWGYSFEDACRRRSMDPANVTIINWEFIG